MTHPDHTVTDRVRRRGARPALAMLVGAAVLVAGCGGGGANPGVADVKTTSTSTTYPSSQADDAGAPTLSAGGSSSSAGGSSQEIEIAGTLELSRCMRANGVPNFPDPNSQGSIQISTSEINPNTPQFDRAQHKCAKYLGGSNAPSPARQTQAQAQALKFSACMRLHGDLDFPDPASGAASTKIGAPGSKPGPASDSGLDPNSPIFPKAQRECRSLMPGGGKPPPGATAS